MKYRIVSVAAATTLVGGLWVGLTAVPAGAVPGQTGHPFTLTLYFGYNPTPNDQTTGTLEPVLAEGPPGSVIDVPVGPPLPTGTCPFDSNAVFTITGNAVGHGVGNNNGFWGGDTIEGTTTVTDPGNESFDGPYTGQATGWQGSGTNTGPNDVAPQQGELGETFHFHGTNGSQSLDVKVSYHGTRNNNGTIVNLSSSVVCS